MANFLERMGLVSMENDDISYAASVKNAQIEDVDIDVPEVDISQIDDEAVIQSIYDQGDFCDESSIYKIRAYIDILPAEMTTAKKQASIAGILSVNGIDVNSLIEDGRKRIAVLDEVDNASQAANESLIRDTEADIENLKAMIEAAEAKIAESKKNTDSTRAVIQKEKESVSYLLEFMEGINGKEGE